MLNNMTLEQFSRQYSLLFMLLKMYSFNHTGVHL